MANTNTIPSTPSQQTCSTTFILASHHACPTPPLVPHFQIPQSSSFLTQSRAHMLSRPTTTTKFYLCQAITGMSHSLTHTPHTNLIQLHSHIHKCTCTFRQPLTQSTINRTHPIEPHPMFTSKHTPRTNY